MIELLPSLALCVAIVLALSVHTYFVLLDEKHEYARHLVYSIVGQGNDETADSWFASYNTALEDIPNNLLKNHRGTDKVISYLRTIVYQL